MRIALLEDEPVQMQLMVARLGTLPMANNETVDCAQFTDGATLRTALLVDVFDLLILDWNFNHTNGLDLVRWMRQGDNDSGLEKLPVIVVSARSAANDAVVALTSGADDYIAKPFGSGDLLGRIGQVMGLAARRRNRPRIPTESSRAPVRPPTACGAGS